MSEHSGRLEDIEARKEAADANVERKEMLAQALREYPTWGEAFIAEKKRADALAAALAAATVERDEAQEALQDAPPPGYVIPEGDERCNFTMDACTCMKRKGHEGLHACAHGGWRVPQTDPKGDK